MHTLVRVTLHVLTEGKVSSAMHRADDGEGEKAAPGITPRGLVPSSLPDPHSRLWYKDFLQLIGYGDAQRVEEYCERVWCSDKKRKKTRRKYAPPNGEKRGKSRGEDPHRAPRHTSHTPF